MSKGCTYIHTAFLWPLSPPNNSGLFIKVDLRCSSRYISPASFHGTVSPVTQRYSPVTLVIGCFPSHVGRESRRSGKETTASDRAGSPPLLPVFAEADVCALAPATRVHLLWRLMKCNVSSVGVDFTCASRGLIVVGLNPSQVMSVDCVCVTVCVCVCV